MLLMGGLSVILFTLLKNDHTFPMEPIESTWEQFDIPEEAGWSSEKLQEAKEYYHSLNSTAAMAIYKGKILFAWGNITENTNAHSVRKSLLSALYGIHIEEGNIELTDTLEMVGVRDYPPLLEAEKQATVADLLTSRSGVYHPSGEESWRMQRNRPDRGSFEPGTHFYYNNWDFNVLGTIFKEKTNSDIFLEFKERIADPIGMEDFMISNTYYKEAPSRSIHPSYLFRMSARDMARFGQLYLQRGQWEGKQIIPEKWVDVSTIRHTPVLSNNVYGYGFMWWVADAGAFKNLGLFSAVGRYGQSIDIIPEKNLVFVHRVNSDQPSVKFLKRNVNQSERLRLLTKVLDAKINE